MVLVVSTAEEKFNVNVFAPQGAHCPKISETPKSDVIIIKTRKYFLKTVKSCFMKI
jgi:hypothetical protein